MKVILLRDVARIGKKGTVANVPDGYAMNQLIPSKSAEPATPQNMKKLEQVLKNKSDQVEADSEAFQAASTKIDAITDLTLEMAANEKGHLFKAVGADDVQELLKSHDVDASSFLVSFKEPIKEIGEHQVVLTNAGENHTITIKVAAK